MYQPWITVPQLRHRVAGRSPFNVRMPHSLLSDDHCRSIESNGRHEAAKGNISPNIAVSRLKILVGWLFCLAREVFWGSSNTFAMEKQAEQEPKESDVEHAEVGLSSPEALDLKAREKKLVRKLDLFVAPVMMMLMLISYLDRGNIVRQLHTEDAHAHGLQGFAATQGMADDIGLVGSQLNVVPPHNINSIGIDDQAGCDFDILYLLHSGRSKTRALSQETPCANLASFLPHFWSKGCNSIESFPRFAAAGA